MNYRFHESVFTSGEILLWAFWPLGGSWLKIDTSQNNFDQFRPERAAVECCCEIFVFLYKKIYSYYWPLEMATNNPTSNLENYEDMTLGEEGK